MPPTPRGPRHRGRRLHPHPCPRGPRARQARRPRRHPLSAGAQRLPAHRPRQVDLPQLRHRRASTAARCNLRFDDTNPTDRGRRVRRVDPATTCAGSASTGTTACTSPPTTSSSSTSAPSELIATGKAYVDSLDDGGDPRVPRHADRGRAATAPTATARSRRTSTCSAACAPASSRRRARAARQDRHGVAEHEHARPAALPHPPRRTTTAPATTGASTRCTTSPTACRDAIEGITHSLCTLEFENHRAALRLVPRQRSTCPPRPQQIEFARLNLTYTVLSKRKLLQLVERGPRRRLGRPAHADPRRPAPPRLHARGDPRRSATRIGVAKAQQHGRRRRCSSTASATTSTGARRACMAVLRPAQGRDRRTTPRARSRSSRRRNNPDDVPSAGTRKVPFAARALHRARRLPRGAAEEVLPPRPGPRGAAALRLLRHLRRAWSRTTPATSSSCAAPTTPRPAAATRPTAARCKGTIHWVSRRSTPSTPRCGSTTACSSSSSPDAPRAATSPTLLNPDSLEVARPARRSSRASPAPSPASRFQFERLGYFCVDPEDSQAGRAGLQPHRHPARHLGQAQGATAADAGGRRARRSRPPRAARGSHGDDASAARRRRRIRWPAWHRRR